MKIDILCPTKNGIVDTVQMFESLKKTTKDFRLIIIDSESSDGTPEFFEGQGVKVLRVPDKGFGFAINQGFEGVKSSDCVVLNNDIILTDGWLESLLDTKKRAKGKIGFVGPVTNYGKGRQKIDYSPIEPLEKFSREWTKENSGKFEEVAFLGFFCVLLDSSMMEYIGKLEEWSPGGFEDDDYLARAWKFGWRAILDNEIFVYHRGGQTFQREFGNADLVLSNRFKFYEKHLQENPSIVALYRVRNDRENFSRSLLLTSKIVDEIFILDDRSDPPLKSWGIEKFPKVKKYFFKTGNEFDEFQDRKLLMDWAKESKHDWALVLDSDETIEESVTYEKLHDLIRVPNPFIRQFVFPEITFWRDDLYRDDGPWANCRKKRLFRIWSEMELKTEGNQKDLKGLHCSANPSYPIDSRRVTNLRILHFGYDSEEKRNRKFEFYQIQDLEKDPSLIGAPDYSHLINEDRILLTKFYPNNQISLNVVGREDDFADIAVLLDESWGAFQERSIYFDSKNDEPKQQLEKIFRAKVLFDPDLTDFAEKRNLLLSSSSERWIFSIDTDERFQNLHALRQLIDFPTDAWLFWEKNFRKNGTFSISEAIRLFRREKASKWKGKIHERIQIDGQISAAPIPILHYGYLKSDQFVGEKLQKYEETLLAELKNQPNDPILLYSLALHLIERGAKENGSALLDRAIQADSKFLQAKIEKGMILLEESRDLIDSAIQLMPESHPLKNNLEDLLQRTKL